MQVEAQIKKNLTLADTKSCHEDKLAIVREHVSEAWQIIAPFWPLKNLIACNPLQGFENLPFEEAIKQSTAYFQQTTLPKNMEVINRETLKWCQAFFDESQATINMPNRKLGLYKAWKKLVPFDSQLKKRLWMIELKESAEETITYCLLKLGIPDGKSVLFLKLLLTTLPGWTSYIKYQTEWRDENDSNSHRASQSDYLAVRIVITFLLWQDAVNLLAWHERAEMTSVPKQIKKISNAEQEYQAWLLSKLYQKAKQLDQPVREESLPIAQLVFCIDVRSEPFRHALEAQDHYQTFGFAGFFGIPARIENEILEKTYLSCPVLLKPKHTVKEKFVCSDQLSRKIAQGYKRISILKRLYQSLKYTFTTPFALVETLGAWSGLWMSLRTVAPVQARWLKQKVIAFFQPASITLPVLNDDDIKKGISYQDQCVYAENALRMVGLTENFAKVIILCGHGSTTENNAYATMLDCGACGGHHGESNAKILACILNDINIRNYLFKKRIYIPNDTVFFAAKHNTTTDEVVLFPNMTTESCINSIINKLKHDLDVARQINNKWRCEQMGNISRLNKINHVEHVRKRSSDWAETRPEWGLARNAAFIVAPRYLTKDIDLEGRSFLHSYDWKQDKEGLSLTTILTAPMVVAQWINNQYLFSLLDNVAYGSGNKITHNITGKIGVMQGNASDLMHGLPLQSIYSDSKNAYHQPLRLQTIVYAPRNLISRIIVQQTILKKLFGNGWVILICIEPDDRNIYYLNRDLTWTNNITCI